MSDVNINKGNIEKEVFFSDIPVILKFWAEWCEPCRKISAEIGKLRADNALQFKLASLNADEYPELMSRFKVFCLPTLVIVKNGTVCCSLEGYHSKEQIMSCIVQ
ncbi:MAG: thioredoxin family protein [Huintestinicola sp.]